MGNIIPNKDSVTNKYTHHTKVDGNNTYGCTLLSFPRRCIVGGNTTITVYAEDAILYPGTRAMAGYVATLTNYGTLS